MEIPSGGPRYSPLNLRFCRGCDFILELPQVDGITDDSSVTLTVNPDTDVEASWDAVVGGGKVRFRIESGEADGVPNQAPCRIRVGRPSPVEGDASRVDNLPWLKGVTIRDD